MFLLRDYTEKELKELAQRMSTTALTLKTKERITLNEEEKSKMSDIVYSALLTARWHSKNRDAQQVIRDHAEFTFNVMLPEYEGYSSIYVPLMNVLKYESDGVYVIENNIP